MKKKFSIKDYLGDKALYWELFRLTLPISAQALIAVGMNMIDTIMLRQMGDAQISAASMAGQYVTLFMACAMGLSMGAAVLTTRYFGMGNLHNLKEATTIMFRWELALTALFTGVAALFPGGVMAFFTADPETIRYGCAYLNWLLPVYFSMSFSQGCAIVLRSAGRLMVPLIGAAAALGVNALLNWAFIFGKLGAPRMEIAGAALATSVAWVFELIVICGWFFFGDRAVGYRLGDLKMNCRELTGEYFRISIPVLVSDGLLGLGNGAMSMVMGHMGQTVAAANSVTLVVQQLSTVLYQGVAGASGVITGHTMGEGDYDKAQRQGYTFVLIGVVVGVLTGAAMVLLREPVIAFYHMSQEAKEIAGALIDTILTVVVLQSVNGILTKGVLRAGGDTRFLMVADVLFLWIASLPLGLLAAFVWHLPPAWVYELMKVDQVLKCAWCLHRLRSGVWKKNIHGKG